MNELYHHGIKGMKWGVRRYQYTDGTLTPAGKKRYQNYNDSSMTDRVSRIMNSKEKMRRPQQQILFNQAQNALKKDPSKMTQAEKISVYKALNLSLVNHNQQEIAAQNRFYGELKKKGYNALLDYNDKEYSSYHAKRPMIVFDTDSVKLSSVTEANPKVVDQMYRRYNTERIAKETIASTIGIVSKYATTKVSECNSYVERKMEDYLR